MNIAVAKLGKSMKFCREKWSGAGGDAEGPILVEILANNNPDSKIFVFGRNDLDMFKKKHPELYTEIFPHDNVVNLCEDINWAKEGITGGTDILADRFSKANIDQVIINIGPAGQVNYENLVQRVDKKGFCKTLGCFSRYAYPIIRIVNELTDGIEIKWMLNDPRYALRAHDLLLHKYPKFYYSQYNSTYTNRGCIKKMEDAATRTFTKVTTPLKYTRSEVIWLYGHQPYDISNLDEDIKEKENCLRIVLNQGKSSGGLDRYGPLMEYIGRWGEEDCIKDVEIYGKWEDEIMEKDPRFKGPKSYDELGELMAKAKCTFAIPIQRGWATSKWCECMHGFKDGKPGLVTFIHPWYDEQKHVFKEDSVLDKFLRVSPEEFRKRVKILFENDDVYKKILKAQYALLKDDYYTGKFLSKLLTI